MKTTGRQATKNATIPTEGPPIKNVSIVILAYNNWEHTRQCLQSVLENSCVPGLEVLVVDNGSSDDTASQLSQWTHPALKVITLPSNMGFSGGNNLGCRQAKGDYLVLLNNDTIVPPGWLQRLLRPLAENRGIGLAGPVTNRCFSEQELDLTVCDSSTGADLCWLREFYRFNRGNMRFAPFLSFFCVALRKSLFREIGELDEQFHVGFFEDNDYCERVKAAGYRLAVAEDAFVYHHGSVSFHQLDAPVFQSVFQTNKERFERKWHTTWQGAPRPSPELAAGSIKLSPASAGPGKRCILLLSGRPWWGAVNRCTELAYSYLHSGNLVILNTPAYYGIKLYGLRQAGPLFYLTNSTELLEMYTFDTIIYCGETTRHEKLRANNVYIDRLSYSDMKPLLDM